MEAAPPVVEPVEEADAVPIEAAAPEPPAEPAAPITLSESVLTDFQSRSERNLEVARLQTQLERSQLRRKQVEEVVGEEVAALRFQLEREVAAERDRSEQASALAAQLAGAKRAKMDGCQREEQLLVQLQDVAQRTTEPAVAASLAAAIETKAGLVAIELVLVEDITECEGQIEEEKRQIELRIAAMSKTLDSLPAADDTEALRLYSWGQVEALQQELEVGAAAIAETEASVAALRQRINDALDQRDAVLGAAPLGPAAAPAPPRAAAVPPPSRTGVKALELEDLDNEALQEAVKGSAQAAGASLKNLGQTLLAFAGNLEATQEGEEAASLFAAATNTTSSALASLTEQTADRELSQSDAAALTKETLSSVSASAKDLGGAAAKAAAAAKLAADQSDLGGSARDALTALGNTAASAGLLALRAVKGAAAKASGAAEEAAQKKAPKDLF